MKNDYDRATTDFFLSFSVLYNYYGIVGTVYSFIAVFSVVEKKKKKKV